MPGASPARPRLRALLAVLPGLGALFASPAGSAGQELPPGVDEGFFDLAVERIPTRPTLVTAVDSTGRVLLPLQTVLEHVGIPVAGGPDSVVLEWPPGVWRTVLVPARREVRRGDSTWTAEPGEWLVSPSGSWMAPGVLGRVLAARVQIDWAQLRVVVTGNRDFPVVRRIELETRRARDRMRAEQLRADLHPHVPYPPRTGGLAASWGVSLATVEGDRRGSLRSALGLAFLGGSLEGGVTGVLVEGGGGTLEDPFGRYSRVFPTTPWIRQLEAGHVVSPAPRARRILGVSLTNDPLTAPRSFGEAAVAPAVPAGWEYEVFQGSHLVGVASEGEDVSIPLNYGNTPVRLRLTGPAGQEVVEELLYVVPHARVPAGEWRYALAGGACEDDPCGATVLGGVRRGVSRWLTLGAGVEAADPDSARWRARPFGGASFSPFPQASVDLEAQKDAFYRAAARWSTVRGGTVGASYTRNIPEPGALTLSGWQVAADASGPFAPFRGRWVTARLLVRGGGDTGGAGTSVQAAASSTVRGTFVQLEYETGLQARDLVTARTFTAFARRLPWGWTDPSLSATVGGGGRGFELAELTASARPFPAGVLSVGVRARRGSDPLFTVSFSARRQAGHVRVRATEGASRSAFATADGGAAFNLDDGWTALPSQTIGRAGVSGRVYEDVDGDGVEGEGEPRLPGIDVLVGGRRVTTDADGRFQTWSVTPYEAVAVSVDSLTMDPYLAPAGPAVLLRPSPNVYAEVPLGVVATRELSGRVDELGDTPRPLGGVAVEVVDGEGAVVARERTFSDGVYYVQRIRPGRYRVRIAPGTLSSLGAVPVPDGVDVVVPAGGDAVVQVPVLGIRRGG